MPARLVAVTDQAREALGDVEHAIARFPFRVGRESRSALTRIAMSIERRLGDAPHVNDVYLVEPVTSQYLHVSREHFQIERDGETFYLRDRGSAGGTLVNGTQVGGDRAGGRIELPDEATIVVGTTSSPYVFRFLVS